MQPAVFSEGPTAHDEPWRGGAPAAAVAGVLGLVGLLSGWRGGDLPAQVFRADMFRRYGFTLWDNRWYGGHPTLDYSLLAPAIGSVIDPRVVGVLATVAAAWLFGLIVWRVWGPNSRLGALWFAVGTATNLAVGRVTFALGLAVALAAVAAIQRKHYSVAVVLALLSSLASPVAGLFVALAAAAWGITEREHRLAATSCAAAALAPIALSAALFPGVGSFPYNTGAVVRDLAVCVGFFFLVPRTYRVLRVGAVLYGATCLAAFAIATPLGANVSRLGQSVAGPILACVLWPARRKLLALIAVPLLLWQWLPAVDGIVHGNADPAAHRGYYAPVLDFLAHQSHATPGRIEVPPLYHHWESVYVGERYPLARGWERQLDIGYHGLFYRGHLDANAYRKWLADNAVEFVALPDGKLDHHSIAERALLQHGVPGLREVFHSARWRVWRVAGYRGFVDGPARLAEQHVDGFTLDVNGPGSILVRERYSPRWTIDGPGCVSKAPGGWTRLTGLRLGRVALTQSLRGSSC
jgi:hypothetical protein